MVVLVILLFRVLGPLIGLFGHLGFRVIRVIVLVWASAHYVLSIQYLTKKKKKLENSIMVLGNTVFFFDKMLEITVDVAV